MSGLLDPLGRSPVLSRLAALAREDRLPQSMLLIGPEGSGKEMAALALARIVLASDESCAQKVNKLAHPDLLWSFPVESTNTMTAYRALLDAKAAEPLARVRQPGSAIIPIGNGDDPHPVSVRSIRRFVAVKPFEGRRRVVIIGDAHRMNRSAANALLKTLEEPPSRALIMLCTHQPHQLPATIPSRCARISLPHLHDEELAGHLTAAHAVEATEASRIAAISGGNARRAFDLLDPAARQLAEWAESVVDLLVRGPRPALVKSAEYISKGQPPRGGKSNKKRNADASLSASRDLGMRILEFVVADLMALSKLAAGARLDVYQQERLAPMAIGLDASALAEAASILLRARADLSRNVNVALVLTDALPMAHDRITGRSTRHGLLRVDHAS